MPSLDLSTFISAAGLPTALSGFVSTALSTGLDSTALDFTPSLASSCFAFALGTSLRFIVAGADCEPDAPGACALAKPAAAISATTAVEIKKDFLMYSPEMPQRYNRSLPGNVPCKRGILREPPFTCAA